MRRPHLTATHTARLFAVYAVASALPILALGLILASSFRGEVRDRGLEEGRTEAALIADTAVRPLLDGRPLSHGLTEAETRGLRRLSANTMGNAVLRLRLRDDAGQVVYSSDGTGVAAAPDPQAIAAARGGGKVISDLTRLNADEDALPRMGDIQPPGPRSIEIYEPLRAVGSPRVLGVLELYLPYAPIDHLITRLVSNLYRDLAIGLGLLYLVLFALTASVTRRLQRASTRNAFLAERDQLTGLPNRTSFLRHAELAVAQARRSGVSAAIAILDLDRFRAVNDALGHSTGDLVLCELAERLSREAGADAYVARLGGDEFGIVLADGDRADQRLRTLRATLDHDVLVDGVPIAVEASIGYALTAGNGDGVGVLMQRADIAMYAAKDQHAGVVHYRASLDQHDAAGLSLLAELRHAIDDDQLVLHYQPQLSADGAHVVALEALVRWQHPRHGLLFPDRFLALAEQTDVIDHLTNWVLRRALRETAAMAGAPMRVAVNVSARSVGGGELADAVIGALTEVGAAPERLTVEMTETALLCNPGRAAAELTRLAGAGVRISLDDFGQGQTSLRHLSALPIHELKIDREFVGDMDTDGAHAAIVRSMVELGRSLGLEVVAEGVETEAVRTLLQTAGSDLLQGYLLSRPLTGEALVQWLAGRPSAPAPPAPPAQPATSPQPALRA